MHITRCRICTGIIFLKDFVSYREFLLGFHPIFQDFIAFGFAYLTNRAQLQNLIYDIMLYESLRTYIYIMNK